MANFLQALGNIGRVAGSAEETYATLQDRKRKEMEAQQMKQLRDLQMQEAYQKMSADQRAQQAGGMAYKGLQGLEGIGQQSQNPMGPGQPSVPMQQPGQQMPPQAPPIGGGAPQGAQMSPGSPPQSGPPGGPGSMPQGGGQFPQLAPALTGPGGAQLPAAFDVKQAMSYLEKQNPSADPVTLFSALGQMGGMWEQLHPQAKQDYQLLRDSIKAQMQMDLLQERLKATDEQIDRRGDLAKTRDQILESGRNSRAATSEQGRNDRSASHESGVESRFDKRQEAQAGKAATAASVKDISDQKTEIKDQITKLNRERAAIKGKYAFGQPPPNSEDFKALQTKAAEIDQLSDQTIQLDRSLRQARSGGIKPAAGSPGDGKDKEPAQAPQSAYKSADDVVSAYKSGKIDHDAASKILKDNGWAD
jgi:hypothetical protein